jgi:hypothetical protein
VERLVNIVQLTEEIQPYRDVIIDVGTEDLAEEESKEGKEGKGGSDCETHRAEAAR